MIEDTKAPIRTLKFSPDGNQLAVGAEPSTLELYSVPDFRRRAVLKKHSGPVTHIDWAMSEKPSYLQAASENQELLFFNSLEFSHVTKTDEKIKNEAWSTLSCIYGWSLQGIWKDHMPLGTEVNIVDRSNTQFYKEYHAVATAEDGCVCKVYKWPCVQYNAEPLLLEGHSSFISNVKWSVNDEHLITVGGEDQTIILWKVQRDL